MYAILHEGKSIDKSFFQLLLDNLELDKDSVRFYGMGTKSNFFNKEHIQYKTLNDDILDAPISKILFIMDADESFENTKEKLKKIIEELGLNEISDFYIACNQQTKKGYLESLILSSMPKEQKECIEAFLNCSEFKSKTHDKSILNEIYKKAYPKAPYDFSHENFDELKQKLQNLFNQ
ncbi:MAG: DUF3226 domain-containing protein [Sulfurimonas sp.]|jgi:hypothetical protein